MKNEIFYSAFGVLTVAFSRMEAHLRMLISGIAFNDNSIAASAFLDSSQLNGNLKILKKLSRQYWDKEEQFLDVIKSIKLIRETRNLFIHGIWHSGNFVELNGFATVTDLKTAYEARDESRAWRHSQTSQFSINDFQRILDDVNNIVDKIEKLRDRLSSDEGIQFEYVEFTAISKPFLVSISDSTSKEDNE